MMQLVEKIAENAAAGRGLWIGLFPTEGTVVEGCGRSTADPHVTIAHLGRGAGRGVVDGAIGACADACKGTNPILARSNGIARFTGGGKDGNPIVVLMRGKDLRRLYESVTYALFDRGVRFDNSFDFLPHVTIGRVSAAESLTVDVPANVAITFDRIGVVCGDARVYYDLKLESVF